jgi:hypothetical protein
MLHAPTSRKPTLPSLSSYPTENLSLPPILPQSTYRFYPPPPAKLTFFQRSLLARSFRSANSVTTAAPPLSPPTQSQSRTNTIPSYLGTVHPRQNFGISIFLAHSPHRPPQPPHPIPPSSLTSSFPNTPPMPLYPVPPWQTELLSIMPPCSHPVYPLGVPPSTPADSLHGPN